MNDQEKLQQLIRQRSAGKPEVKAPRVSVRVKPPKVVVKPPQVNEETDND